MTSCIAPVPAPVPATRSLGTSMPVVTPDTMVFRLRGDRFRDSVADDLVDALIGAGDALARSTVKMRRVLMALERNTAIKSCSCANCQL